MEWLKLAQNLSNGGSRRVTCWECEGDNTMSITNMVERFTFHCFKCKSSGSHLAPPMTPQERRVLELAAQGFVSSIPSLPPDFVADIPVEGLLWLTKGGLHLEDIARYGFGWSAKLRRVIMPVLHKGVLVAVQARSCSKSVQPKYLSQVASGPRPVFRADALRNNNQRTICLTEDILSAVRVGKVSEAWGLLGTNLMQSTIAEIAMIKDVKVFLWLDDDTAGINARRKMRVQLSSIGVETYTVFSDRDPKMHTLSEIKELLCTI